MTDIDTAIRAAVRPWRKDPIYIQPCERAIWEAAFNAGVSFAAGTIAMLSDRAVVKPS